MALTDDERAAVPDRNKSFSALPKTDSPLDSDSPGTTLVSEIAPVDGDIVVRKQRVGPFTTTDLADQLAARGIDTLVLAGISTSGVVLSTVRYTADADFRVYVLADATFDSDPEVHEVLMTKVFPRQAWVITNDELGELLER